MKAQEFKHQSLPVTNERTINSVLDFKDYHISYDPARRTTARKQLLLYLATVYFLSYVVTTASLYATRRTLAGFLNAYGFL